MITKKAIWALIAPLLIALTACSTTSPVPTSATEISPLTEGKRAPEVTLSDATGKPFDLLAAIKQKPSIVIFYRGGWCPYCSQHLAEIQEIEGTLIERGYQILAISPDQPEKLAELQTKSDLSYKLLSDSNMDAAKAFGIAFKLDAPTLEKLDSYNIDIEAASGQTHHLLPVPAIFVVGTDGIITFSHTNPDYTTRLSASELLKATAQ